MTTMTRPMKQAIKRLTRKYHGRCSACKKPFPMQSHTYTGFDYAGKMQSVGDCCYGSIDIHIAAGIWVDTKKTTPEEYKQLLDSHPYRSYITNDSNTKTEHIKG